MAWSIWLLYLTRQVAQGRPLLRQKPKSRLTPQRVQQDLTLIFAQFGSPTRMPNVPRGNHPIVRKAIAE
jgi:hypothetical protein